MRHASLLGIPTAEEAAVAALAAAAAKQQAREVPRPFGDAELRVEVGLASFLPAKVAMLVGLRREERRVRRGVATVLARLPKLATALLPVRLTKPGHLHAVLMPMALALQRVARDVAAIRAVPAPVRDPAVVPTVAGVVAASPTLVTALPSARPTGATRGAQPARLPPPFRPEVGRQGGEVVVVPRQVATGARGPQGDAVTMSLRVAVALPAIPAAPVAEGRALKAHDGVPALGHVDVGPLPVP